MPPVPAAALEAAGLAAPLDFRDVRRVVAEVGARGARRAHRLSRRRSRRRPELRSLRSVRRRGVITRFPTRTSRSTKPFTIPSSLRGVRSRARGGAPLRRAPRGGVGGRGGGEGAAPGLRRVRRGPRDDAFHHAVGAPGLPLFDFSFVPEFEKRLARELDFAWEGRSCERAGALADDPRVVTPGVHWPLTSSKVLAMEYVRGVKVDDGPGSAPRGSTRETPPPPSRTPSRGRCSATGSRGDPHPRTCSSEGFRGSRIYIASSRGRARSRSRLGRRPGR